MKRVIEYMSWPVLCISSEASVVEARQMIGSYQIGRLPVINGDGQLIGIVSTDDLACADTTNAINDCMSRQVTTISPRAPIGDAIVLLTESDIGGLPVVIDNYVVGMITWHDLREVEHVTTYQSCMLCGSGRSVEQDPAFSQIPLCISCRLSDSEWQRQTA